MIGVTTIKNIMKRVTDKPVSIRAALTLGEAAERYIEKKTREAENLLKQRNELRKKQGLRVMQRISEKLIRETFNGKEY